MRKYDGQREDEKPTALRIRQGKKMINLGDFGQLGYFSGFPGTMKSTHLRYIVAAGLSGEERLCWNFKLGLKKVLSIDTQQPWDIYKFTQSQIEDICGKKPRKGQYHSYWLTDEPSPKDKCQIMYELLAKHQDGLGMVIIDTLKDLTADPDDKAEVQPLVSNIMSFLASHNVLTIIVHHRTAIASHSGGGSKLSHKLGREVWEQSSFGMLSEKEGRYFKLSPDKTRYESPLPLTVTMDRVNKLLIPEPHIPW